MRRTKTNPRKDKARFSRTASRTHRRNLQSKPATQLRGGHRI